VPCWSFACQQWLRTSSGVHLRRASNRASSSPTRKRLAPNSRPTRLGNHTPPSNPTGVSIPSTPPASAARARPTTTFTDLEEKVEQEQTKYKVLKAALWQFKKANGAAIRRPRSPGRAWGSPARRSRTTMRTTRTTTRMTMTINERSFVSTLEIPKPPGKRLTKRSSIKATSLRHQFASLEQSS
jgi:hypothetical protein